MCGIAGSFDINEVEKLYNLNLYRGTTSSAFCAVNAKNEIVLLRKFPGVIKPEFWADIRKTVKTTKSKPQYYITHSQAPTTSADDCIHPAEYNGQFLWHNGIIKPKYMQELNARLDSNIVWDTALINRAIQETGFGEDNIFSEIDGSFACVMLNGDGLYIFRNEISPLFYNFNLSISSTRFENSSSVNPNSVYRIDIKQKRLYNSLRFSDFENPYFIPEED